MPSRCSTATASTRTRRPPRRCSARRRCTAAPIAQDRLARILADGRGAPADPVEATKWHLISQGRAARPTSTLDDFVNKLDADTRAAGEKAAKPWLDAIK